jgi:hypothetical protein
MISISKTVCHHFQHRLIPPLYTRVTYCNLYQLVGGSFQVQNFFAISLFHWPEKSPKSLKTPIVEVCTPHISPTICPYRFQEHNALQSICDKVVSYWTYVGNSMGTWEHVENPLRTQCEQSENFGWTTLGITKTPKIPQLPSHPPRKGKKLLLCACCKFLIVWAEFLHQTMLITYFGLG